VDSYRDAQALIGGLTLAPELADGSDCLTVRPASWRAVTALRVAAIEPQSASDTRVGAGLQRHWGSIYSCFRPELGGFSNNAASVNCHVNQWAPSEIVAHTQALDGAVHPLALGRHTVARALLDGGGYGYWRNLYLDSDPILVAAAGKLYQAEPDADWLRHIGPGLKAATRRMLSSMDERGLVICKDLTGNAGSHRWSSNAMDVIGFGHIDAYVNAWTYRALRNASALLSQLKAEGPASADLANRSQDAAQALRAAYAPALLNPATGWIAGWRSQDGQLHDYAFTFVNGPAIAFGLLDPPEARRALSGLESLRERRGPRSAEKGIPTSLLPIDEADHMLPEILGRLEPTFELYTDGGLCGAPAAYYLRALDIYGFDVNARRLADELEAGLARGNFTGGLGAGVEFRSWDGLPTGYEGTLIVSLGPLYAIAIQRGAIQPMEPEWWPSQT
jgi:hypothetical protein